ncbi:hypothetical protein PVIIG_05932 [Plasmodium vivax India VII]|uniref:Uncharacterized protein n=1 Tax=Plasmodium vivax India VII TaxID=1077284 RepID=A0A0J9S2A3_PLAVI|nr:hypothetical protein PVIIG_05932 [Plasmodium vivax India VII]
MQEREADATRVSHNGGTFEGREPNSEDSDGRMMPDDAPKFSGNPKTVENVGGMIRNGLGWNNNNMRNFNGEDNRLYDYASEPFNPYPGEEHYIGYHPA